MGSRNSICDHAHLRIEFVKGSPINYDTATSYADTFAHFSCPECNLNCFRKRSYYHSVAFGRIAENWIAWTPKDESETAPRF